jgi:hypothetical protein
MTARGKYLHLRGLGVAERMRAYGAEYRSKFPEKAILKAAKSRAKIRGLDFNIELSDIAIPELCPILKTPIIIHSGTGKQGGHMDSPSLDKIDNNKGYVKGNVQVISHKANSMKFNATPDELVLFAEWILKTYKKDDKI